jgi:hypothetical protein
MIVPSGFKVYPTGIEDVVALHPDCWSPGKDPNIDAEALMAPGTRSGSRS